MLKNTNLNIGEPFNPSTQRQGEGWEGREGNEVWKRGAKENRNEHKPAQKQNL